MENRLFHELLSNFQIFVDLNSFPKNILFLQQFFLFWREILPSFYPEYAHGTKLSINTLAMEKSNNLKKFADLYSQTTEET